MKLVRPEAVEAGRPAPPRRYMIGFLAIVGAVALAGAIVATIHFFITH